MKKKSFKSLAASLGFALAALSGTASLMTLATPAQAAAPGDASARSCQLTFSDGRAPQAVPCTGSQSIACNGVTGPLTATLTYTNEFNMDAAKTVDVKAACSGGGGAGGSGGADPAAGPAFAVGDVVAWVAYQSWDGTTRNDGYIFPGSTVEGNAATRYSNEYACFKLQGGYIIDHADNLGGPKSGPILEVNTKRVVGDFKITDGMYYYFGPSVNNYKFNGKSITTNTMMEGYSGRYEKVITIYPDSSQNPIFPGSVQKKGEEAVMVKCILDQGLYWRNPAYFTPSKK